MGQNIFVSIFLKIETQGTLGREEEWDATLFIYKQLYRINMVPKLKNDLVKNIANHKGPTPKKY